MSKRDDEINTFTASYECLPEHMREVARRYVEDGIEPGSFLSAVLGNNLTLSFILADERNRKRMADFVTWLLHRCPRGAWGDAEKVKHWQRRGGMNGISRQAVIDEEESTNKNGEDHEENNNPRIVNASGTCDGPALRLLKRLSTRKEH